MKNFGEIFKKFRESRGLRLKDVAKAGILMSRDVDFYKQCQWEKQEFEKFVNQILIPELKEKLGVMYV